MNRLDRDNFGSSKDIVDDNIEKLKEIFPDVFSEEKIDFEKLREKLGEFVDTKQERYNFTWHGKTKAKKIAQKPSTGTLRPAKEESENWDNTENLYIEGDNLEVLKLLQKSYHNKVKMIYIDPPYNTGKDFVYKDNYKDNLQNYLEITDQVDDEGNKLSTNSESSGRYHSDWLDMMYPRLKLARNLLKEDGVIFISIDDNEVHNLRKICDEIFGENNFLGLFIIKSTPNARDYGHIGKMHEFALFYAKNSNYTDTNELVDKSKSFKYSDDISKFNIHPLYNSNVKFTPENRPNLYYPFYLYKDKKIGDNFYEIGLEKKPNSLKIYPPRSVKDDIQFVWRWGKDKASKNLNTNIIGYKNTNGEFRIVQKMRGTKKIVRSMLLKKSFISRKGTAEVEDVFGNKIYSFPKPIELLKRFIKVGSNKNSLILDFFSGSSTTAHAIMECNVEEQSNRKFIMVQLPEPTPEKSDARKAGFKTISDIGKERIRRAGEKIKEENKDNDNIDYLDTGFKVFKLDSSNIKTWDVGLEDDLEQNLFDMVDNIKDDRAEEDILYELLLKYGLDLTLPIEKLEIKNKNVYVIGFGALVICLDQEVDLELVEEIGKLKEKYQPEIMRVVFKDSGFKNDVVKTNAIQILDKYNIDDVKSL